MKKIILITFTIIIFVLMMCSCTQVSSKENERMVKIKTEALMSTTVQIFYDRETGVEYMLCGDAAPIVLMDENGNPLIHKK